MIVGARTNGLGPVAKEHDKLGSPHWSSYAIFLCLYGCRSMENNNWKVYCLCLSVSLQSDEASATRGASERKAIESITGFSTFLLESPPESRYISFIYPTCVGTTHPLSLENRYDAGAKENGQGVYGRERERGKQGLKIVRSLRATTTTVSNNERISGLIRFTLVRRIKRWRFFFLSVRSTCQSCPVQFSDNENIEERRPGRNNRLLGYACWIFHLK